MEIKLYQQKQLLLKQKRKTKATRRGKNITG
jgi:hypothetical protein